MNQIFTGMFKPKGTDGRLDYLVKSILIIIYSLVIFFPILLTVSIFVNINNPFRGAAVAILVFTFIYAILKNIIVARRVRNLQKNIFIHLLLYNANIVFTTLGLVGIFLGHWIFGQAALGFGAIGSIIWFVLNFMYLFQKGDYYVEIEKKPSPKQTLNQQKVTLENVENLINGDQDFIEKRDNSPLGKLELILMIVIGLITIPVLGFIFIF